jgi:hypothetical protein
MVEYFLMLGAFRRIRTEVPVDEDDGRIYSKFCSINSPFCQGVVERLGFDPSELRLHLVRMNEEAWELLEASERFHSQDLEILDPDSTIAHFSFALVSLLATFEARHGSVDARAFTDGLGEVFGARNRLGRMALLDGFVREEERLRVDFRGLKIEDCLFHSFDIWNCQFDDGTVFSRCRFMNCAGVFSRSSGMQNATFEPGCQFDADFERTLAAGNEKIQGSEAQNIESIRSFIDDFYRSGGFRVISVENLERYYGESNSVVPFKKLYRFMKRCGVVSEEDKGHYVNVSITREASASAERLITQGVLTGQLAEVAVGLR